MILISAGKSVFVRHHGWPEFARVRVSGIDSLGRVASPDRVGLRVRPRDVARITERLRP